MIETLSYITIEEVKLNINDTKWKPDYLIKHIHQSIDNYK